MKYILFSVAILLGCLSLTFCTRAAAVEASRSDDPFAAEMSPAELKGLGLGAVSAGLLIAALVVRQMERRVETSDTSKLHVFPRGQQ